MRIATLDLLAYGPFRGLSLDLEAPGLHVVYGRNEAGKSTTLRAITGLLYGIERTTRDAHVHKPAELRIGGVLVGADGARIAVVRRKGNANTLLDERGQPVAEDVMTRLLRGISEETFRHAFGLDHDALRRGAEALLAGRGDLGESLFDASVGGGGDVQRLLERLEKEADDIYRPRAQSLPLNEAIKAFTEAQKAIKEKQSLPEAFVTQETRLAELRAELASRATRKKELAAQRSRLEAARQRVPLDRRRAHLAAQRAELGAIPSHVARLLALRERSGAYEVNTRAQNDLTAELELLRDRLATARDRAGLPAEGGDGAPRLDAKGEARLLRLVADRDATSASLRTLGAELERARRELARAREVASGSAPDDTTALVRALANARRLGDVEARLVAAEGKLAKKRRDVEARAASAGLGTASLHTLPSCRLPSIETIDALAARATEADRAEARATDKVAELDAQVLSLAQQIASLAGDFAPPDLDALRAARKIRDDAFTKLRMETAAGGDARSRVALETEVERAVRAVDDVADRMIREADRVTSLARLRSAYATATEQLDEKRADAGAARAARSRIDGDLAAAFAASGLGDDVVPKTIAEARALVVKLAALALQLGELGELGDEVAELGARVATSRTELVAALGSSSASGESVAALVEAGAARLEAADAHRRELLQAGETARRLEETVAEREATIAREEAALADVVLRIGEIALPLGVAADASTDEATRALEALRDLQRALEKRAEVAAKAEAAAREARGFEEEIARLTRDLAPDLAGLSARDAATELVARATRAEAVVRDLDAVEARLGELGETELPEDVVALAADEDAASRAAEELDAELGEVENALERAKREVVSVELGLAQMRSDSLAADEASRAEEALARVRAHVERYCRAKVAAKILAQEIDRYREENQGPLLSRASSLFAELTLGAYAGIRAGFDDKDKACLLPLRSDGTEVRVDGLSEGTRDQLYLSLRLSSLERHADVAGPMPLVLDDVLIQLDDERARAALVVLAGLAQRMQVLFFTHHARLVELARAALDARVLHVHELAPRAALHAADAAAG